jgi:hypothetical protein
MIARAKFSVGVLLYNVNTREDGLVTKAYQSAETGEPMYTVNVPVRDSTWALGHLISDWAERVLELSDNAMLKNSDRPPVTTEGPLNEL